MSKNKYLKIVFTVLFILIIYPLSFSAKKQLTIALDWYINPDHAPLLLAKTKGYFQDRNIDVKFISPAETSEPAQLVSAGKADIALVYETQYVSQVSAGMPLEYFATLLDHPLGCITVLKKSNIKNLEDLKSKRIGYANDGTDNAILETMLNHNGIKLSDVELINIKMNLTQSLLSHRVSAVYGMMRNVEPVQLENKNIKTKLFLPENNGIPPYNELIMVAKKNQIGKPVYKKFIKSLKKAIKFLKENPELAWRKVKKDYKQSLAVSSKMESMNHAIWKVTIKYFADKPEKIDKTRFKKFVNFLSKKDVISKEEGKKVIDRTF